MPTSRSKIHCQYGRFKPHGYIILILLLIVLNLILIDTSKPHVQDVYNKVESRIKNSMKIYMYYTVEFTNKKLAETIDGMVIAVKTI